MAGVDVLEQAVLDPVGRHEHHAGGVPLVLVHQRAHGGRAAAADVLDVGDQVERPVAERRPRSAVDRPADARPGLRRVAVGRALRHHAAGDRDALDVRRGIGQRHVDQQRRPSGLRQPLRPGRGEDRPVRDRQPAANAGAVLEDVEDAVPGRVAPGQEGRPGRPRVRGQARPGNALLAGGDQPRQVRQLAPLQHRVEDVPVGSVPAHDQHASSHGPQDTGGRARPAPGASDAQICIRDV